MLIGVQPPIIENPPKQAHLEYVDPGKYFLRTNDLDFDMLTRSRQWFNFASTKRLLGMLDRSDSRRQAGLAVQLHMRLTRPILGALLVILGLSVILRDQNRNVFIGTGLCLGTSALFFGAIFACKHLGENDYLSPPLAGWLPVLVFFPVTLASFDAIHT